MPARDACAASISRSDARRLAGIRKVDGQVTAHESRALDDDRDARRGGSLNPSFAEPSDLPARRGRSQARAVRRLALSMSCSARARRSASSASSLASSGLACTSARACSASSRASRRAVRVSYARHSYQLRGRILVQVTGGETGAMTMSSVKNGNKPYEDRPGEFRSEFTNALRRTRGSLSTCAIHKTELMYHDGDRERSRRPPRGDANSSLPHHLDANAEARRRLLDEDEDNVADLASEQPRGTAVDSDVAYGGVGRAKTLIQAQDSTAQISPNHVLVPCLRTSTLPLGAAGEAGARLSRAGYCGPGNGDVASPSIDAGYVTGVPIAPRLATGVLAEWFAQRSAAARTRVRLGTGAGRSGRAESARPEPRQKARCACGSCELRRRRDRSGLPKGRDRRRQRQRGSFSRADRQSEPIPTEAVGRPIALGDAGTTARPRR